MKEEITKNGSLLKGPASWKKKGKKGHSHHGGKWWEHHMEWDREEKLEKRKSLPFFRMRDLSRRRSAI